ncbi:uncharacterized protein LOC106463618 [Limulus polyphemus]|uniref:ATP-dependent DNA helicase n=1 Tax=Limulus polyphemus TaxID=6850 RepID=A0ABM1BCA4_LIMPO|nr:uncharacterized protein LOC106463618 [Limulus polyphemus]
MGGVTFIMAGDFRQTQPVVPRGTKADELNAIIWRHVTKLRLRTNKRVKLHGEHSASAFTERLLDIGEDKVLVDSQDGIKVLPCDTMVSSLDEIKNRVFLSITHHYHDQSWLCERAILAPKNDAVNKLNEELLQQIPGGSRSYTSIDTILETDQAVYYPIEFINSLQPPGVPPHNLVLEKGALIMLI